jgi:hypothetical protein
MSAKLIAIEELEGPLKELLQRVMRLVPSKDKADLKLRRLVAFRLRIDGETSTIEYLNRKAREAAHCFYTGSFYDFIKDDVKKQECVIDGAEPDPPDVA